MYSQRIGGRIARETSTRPNSEHQISMPRRSSPGKPGLGDVEMAELRSEPISATSELPAALDGAIEAVNPMHALPTEEERARASIITRKSLASSLWPSASEGPEMEKEDDEEKDAEDEAKHGRRTNKGISNQSWRSSPSPPPPGSSIEASVDDSSAPTRAITSWSISSTGSQEDAT